MGQFGVFCDGSARHRCLLASPSVSAYNLTGKIISSGGNKMANLATTKLSSRGQVVIPEDIRRRLKLKTGSQFIVVGENDVVILKAIVPPSMKDFDTLIAEARKQGKNVGLKRSDIMDAVGKARGRKRK